MIENVSGVEVVSLVEGERWFLTGRERTQAGTAKYHIAVPDYYIHKQGDEPAKAGNDRVRLIAGVILLVYKFDF